MFLWSGRTVYVLKDDGDYRKAIVIGKVSKDRYSVASYERPSVTWTAEKSAILTSWIDFWSGRRKFSI